MTEKKENPKKRRTRKPEKEDSEHRLKGKPEREREDLPEGEDFLQDPAQIEKDFKEVANDPRVYEDRTEDNDLRDSEDEDHVEDSEEDEDQKHFFYAEEADFAGEDDEKL